MRGKYDTARLSQSACLLEGLCINLHRTDGNFAVVIHSYKDCANVFPRGMTSIGQPSPGRFFCTNISEADVMSGRTIEKLCECVEVVAREKCPEIIYVFASCVSELIGDDIAGCIDGLRGRVVMPVIAVTSSGLDDVSQKRIVDWHADLMYRACGDGVCVKDSVNLMGFPPDVDGEIEAMLGAAGIRVNAWLHGLSPLTEWKKLPSGALNVVVEEALFSTTLGKMELERGIPWIEAPAPIGIGNTDLFYNAVASALGREKEMEAATAEARKKAASAAKEMAKKRSGLRVAYNVGTDKNYEPYRVAADGLGEAGFFKEAGFELTLLIQGSPDPGRQALIEKYLKRLGIKASFDIFVDNVSIRQALENGRYDLLYCVQLMSEIVRPTRTPMIAIGRLRMGYEGFLHNAELVGRALARGRT